MQPVAFQAPVPWGKGELRFAAVEDRINLNNLLAYVLIFRVILKRLS